MLVKTSTDKKGAVNANRVICRQDDFQMCLFGLFPRGTSIPVPSAVLKSKEKKT